MNPCLLLVVVVAVAVTLLLSNGSPRMCSIADNPIVFASDGFVKVTGYTRPEIVPRNCRFLQGAHTDRQAVARLRNAIYEQKESVELLLNYKKNGDPFWNLLYTGK